MMIHGTACGDALGACFSSTLLGVGKPSHLREDLKRIRDVEEGIQRIYLSQKFRIFSAFNTAAPSFGPTCSVLSDTAG